MHEYKYVEIYMMNVFAFDSLSSLMRFSRNDTWYIDEIMPVDVAVKGVFIQQIDKKTP